MNYEKPLRHSERTLDVLTQCKGKQGAPTINQSLPVNRFSVLQIYHYHNYIHFIFVRKPYLSTYSAYVTFVGYNFTISQHHYDLTVKLQITLQMQCVNRFMIYIDVSQPVFRRTSLEGQREIVDYIYMPI